LSKSSRNINLRVPAILVIVSIVITLVALAWSGERGRLQYEVDYEDVITHIDGLKRWRNLTEGGVGELIAEYINTPPHAPLHSLMAATAFALMGPQDWAPYALSGVLVFFFLLLVWRETKRFGRAGAALALAGAVFVPVVYQSVHQFRPDFPCALAMLWAMVVFPRWGAKDFGRMAAISGALFGLALLAKPPFFPYTLAMGFLPWLLAVLGGVAATRAIWPVIGKTWPFFVGCALVAGPHYLIAWRHILEYIQFNQFGDSAHVWKMTGGLDFQLVYHFAGYSGQIMFGNAVWVLLALALGGLIIAVIKYSSEPDTARRLGRLLGLTLWAWVFIAWNPHMNPFFGLTFQYALVLSAMATVAWATKLALGASFPARAGVLIPVTAVGALAVTAFPMIDYRPEYTNAPVKTREFAREIPRDVLNAFEKWREYSDSGYTMLSTYGLVSSHRLQWMANKARQDFQFHTVPYWDVDRQVELIDPESKGKHRVDFAFMAEPGALGVYEDLPNSDTTGDLLRWIQSQPDYTLVESFPTPSGQSYHLFMALPNFASFRSVGGLAKKTAPLPMPGSPVVMGALGQHVELTYDSPTEGNARLELALRGQPPATTLSVMVDGQLVSDVPIVRDADFPKSELILPLRKGINQIAFFIKSAEGNPISKPQVQFRTIRITPAGDTSPMQDILRKARE